VKRSLVVGVDDTDDSRNALARAVELAQAASLRLVVVHIRHIPVFAEMSSMTISSKARRPGRQRPPDPDPAPIPHYGQRSRPRKGGSTTMNTVHLSSRRRLVTS
jgi:nucleotide-binding universal stress UspA family protein